MGGESEELSFSGRSRQVVGRVQFNEPKIDSKGARIFFGLRPERSKKTRLVHVDGRGIWLLIDLQSGLALINHVGPWKLYTL